MDVSIVIVSFNTADMTLACLASIVDQAKEKSYEIIVVDNGSSDGTPERISSRFADVRLIRNITNRGLAAATTQGLKLAGGRYVLAMNSDVVVLDRAVDQLIRFMDDHPNVGGATPKLLMKDASLHAPPFGPTPKPWMLVLEVLSELMGRVMPYSSRFKADDVDLDKDQEVECVVWGTSFIVRREAMRQIGYQDPRFFVYGEDVDWSMRLKKAGWKLWYVPAARVIHYGGQSADGESPRMIGIRMQSSIKLVRKHYGAPAALGLRGTLVFSGLFGYLKWLVLSFWPNVELQKMGPERRSRFMAILRAGLS